jgi:methyl-accepting chemotaxis protein
MIVSLSICSYLFLAKPIGRRLSEINRNVEQLAEGDLNVVVETSNNDEIGALGKNLNKMIQSFNKTLKDIAESANSVVTSADIVNTRIGQTEEGTKMQALQASQIATAAEEMTQTIADIAQNASTASETAGNAMQTAQEGRSIADGAVDTVNKVHASTKELASMIERLSRRVSEIGDIVTVINDIADQTNLLALNAAIEAARAGEQGRGFSVVADEVRKLAERTIKATAEISEKIGAVQGESEKTTVSMREASEQVSHATKYINQVEGSLESIVRAVQDVSDQITRIAAAVEEQSAVAEDVTGNIEKTAGIAGQIEKSSTDVTREVANLLKVAEELRNDTAGFKINGAEMMVLDISKTDHRLFVNKVRSCLKGEISLDPLQMPDHHTCRFGKWYDTEGKDRCGALSSYAAVSPPHEKIHHLAKEAVAAHRSGDKEKAHKLLINVEETSHVIMGLLDALKRECTG